MIRASMAVVLFFLCFSMVAQAQGVQYEQGEILSVTKLEHSSSSGTDAPLAAPRDRYDITIQIGETVYRCRYNAMQDQDLSWLKGKTGQVRVKGKAIFVRRANGSEATAKILSTAKATP